MADTAGDLGREGKRRLDQQAALLRVAQAVTSELRLGALIQRLVDELAELLGADAADCYLYEAETGTLRCAAVHGLPATLVGFEFPAGKGLAGEAVRTGRAALSAVYGDSAGAARHSAYTPFRAAIVAPMMWSGTVRGVLGVATKQTDRVFQRADTELLEAFASLASLALNNAQSFEQSARQAQVQRGFYTIASALSQPVSLDETLDALAQAATEALGATCAAVVMPGADSTVELAGAHELPPSLHDFLRKLPAEADVPLAASLRSRRIVAAPAVLDDHRFAEGWHRVAQETRFRSLLSIPVDRPRRPEAVLAGAVIVFFAEERTFTDEELELARHLAGAARGALERSELFEAERGSRALAQHLARTGSLLASELDQAAILEELAQQAPALLGVDACSVSLLEQGELVVRAAHGAGAEAAVGGRVSPTARLADDVVQSRAPVAVDSVAGDERLIEADVVLSSGYEAYLGVPLVGPGPDIHGVLAVYARTPRVWRDEEVEALVALATNASAVLSNAKLYQRVALERERSVAILANVADGIVAVDGDDNVVLWNTAAERITGIAADEALGRAASEVLHRDLGSGEPRAGTRLVAVRRGSEEVLLSLTEAVMRDPAGDIAGRVFAFRDISAERVVDEMRSEFVSAVSQDLRSPLTSIYGFAATLLRDDVAFEPEQHRTFLRYIASESERLTRIVDALLNVARLDGGDLQVRLAPTDLRSLVSEVIAGFEATPAASGHRLVAELPEGPLDAVADDDKLRLVLANLVDNAVRYSPDGATVRVVVRRKAATLELRVSDEGIGIPLAEQERVFAKFYRRPAAGAAPGARGGTGLGLFIAQGLVAAMGGRISVTSSEGAGSTFSFELPLARQPALTARE